eukprot:m.22799 g.22799  ORF g.22799 m.22799 type:complete len:86 (+) comp8424_c0_seq1:109-366(+)
MCVCVCPVINKSVLHVRCTMCLPLEYLHSQHFDRMTLLHALSQKTSTYYEQHGHGTTARSGTLFSFFMLTTSPSFLYACMHACIT